MSPTARAILVADDNASLRTVLVRAIAQAGFQVQGASDGVEALVAFEADVTGDIGLLITDWAMPRLDGVALIGVVRAARPGLKILLISTNPLPEHFRGDGAVSFMQKPFLPSELVAKARELLA